MLTGPLTARLASRSIAYWGNSERPSGTLAELYLGNILYAIELAAHTLEDQGRSDDAAFYRGIARKLAEARGREKGEGNREQETGNR